MKATPCGELRNSTQGQSKTWKRRVPPASPHVFAFLGNQIMFLANIAFGFWKKKNFSVLSECVYRQWQEEGQCGGKQVAQERVWGEQNRELYVWWGPPKLQKWFKVGVCLFPFGESMSASWWQWSTNQIEDILLLVVTLKQLKSIKANCKWRSHRIFLLPHICLILPCLVSHGVSSSDLLFPSFRRYKVQDDTRPPVMPFCLSCFYFQNVAFAWITTSAIWQTSPNHLPGQLPALNSCTAALHTAVCPTHCSMLLQNLFYTPLSPLHRL